MHRIMLWRWFTLILICVFCSQAALAHVQLEPIEEDPYANLENANLYIDRGRVAESLGMYAAALGAYEKAVALEPDYAPTIYNLGMDRFNVGEEDVAIMCFRSYIQFEPTDYDGHFQLVRSYMDRASRLIDGRRDREIAMGLIREIMRQGDGFRRQVLSYGQQLMGQNRLRSSKQVLQTYLQAYPRDGEAHAALSHVYWLVGLEKEDDTAQRYFTLSNESLVRAVEVEDFFAFQALSRGKGLYDINRFSDAILFLELYHSWNPEDVYGMEQLGLAYTQFALVSDTPDKYLDLGEATLLQIADENRTADVFFGLGLIALERGNYGHARHNFEKAIELETELSEQVDLLLSKLE